MIEWLNFLVMVLSSLMMLLFYLKSVSPAALSTKIGEKAYRRCYYYRLIASFFEFMIIITYIVYVLYPLNIPNIPQIFPWDWRISIFLGIIIAIPSGTLMIKGLIDAGKEAIAPQLDQKLYSGIYSRIRHPQAIGELPLWWVGALFLNSPFLAIYSFIFIPIFFLMIRAEEKDLLIRFGEEYEKYRRNTSILIPKLRKKDDN